MVREDDHNTASGAQALQAQERSRWTESLIHRWPTALGIAFAILIALGLESGSKLSFLLFVVGLGYLVPAALKSALGCLDGVCLVGAFYRSHAATGG